MKNENRTIMGAVKESLAKSDRYFSKPTIENAHPTKVVTIADIDAHNIQESQKQDTDQEST